MDPITMALLAFGGGALGSILGWVFGRSAAEKRIEELLRTIARLQEINRQREAEIAALRKRVETLEAEVRNIREMRNFLVRFIRWVIGEDPEVVARFRAAEEATARVEAIRSDMSQDATRVDAEVQALRREFPEKMAHIEERLRTAV